MATFDVKKAEIENSVKVLLKGLGEDVNREGLIKTPHRVAKALLDATRGYKETVDGVVLAALFPEDGFDDPKLGQAGGVGGLVIVRDLDLFSHCESCLLPFHVKCQVGYVPSGQRVVGLSKLSRAANVFAKRLQEPQRLAYEICTGLQNSIQPTGVAVILECFHIHPPAGSESWSLGTTTEGFNKITVSSGTGVFQDANHQIWSEFFGLLKCDGSITREIQGNHLKNSSWCPLIANPVNKTVNSEMVTAVGSIIRLLGEDPSRKKLVDTPARYVKWLMDFENNYSKLNGFASNVKLDDAKGNGQANGHTNGNLKKTIYSETNLSFLSQCEHHLLPFHGVVHIGYFKKEGTYPLSRSVVQSIVHFFGYKLQVQERCTRQIAETIAPLVGGDIIVMAEASHTCMISRGIEKFGSSTSTIAVLGRFSTDVGARTKFLESLSN